MDNDVPMLFERTELVWFFVLFCFCSFSFVIFLFFGFVVSLKMVKVIVYILAVYANVLTKLTWYMDGLVFFRS